MTSQTKQKELKQQNTTNKNTKKKADSSAVSVKGVLQRF
jgi:hypothetical protein